ncbi:hypothetical protein ACRYCC_33175 [Actinomadura scrupuli]|uniref:hypothetical protein n=1 Tax=Actinomadura scrupuli TaxID=559629 RepID=UPI003D968465
MPGGTLGRPAALVGRGAGAAVDGADAAGVFADTEPFDGADAVQAAVSWVVTTAASRIARGWRRIIGNGYHMRGTSHREPGPPEHDWDNEELWLAAGSVV